MRSSRWRLIYPLSLRRLRHSQRHHASGAGICNVFAGGRPQQENVDPGRNSVHHEMRPLPGMELRALRASANQVVEDHEWSSLGLVTALL